MIFQAIIYVSSCKFIYFVATLVDVLRSKLYKISQYSYDKSGIFFVAKVAKRTQR